MCGFFGALSAGEAPREVVDFSGVVSVSPGRARMVIKDVHCQFYGGCYL